MRLAPFSRLLLLGVIPIAIACGDQSPPATSDAPNAANPPATGDESPNTPGSGAIVDPGQYCYSTTSDTLDAVVRLTVAADQTLTGDSRATISNEAEGYFSSYAQQISGPLEADQLTAQVRTWIEYDVQDTEETWTVTTTEVTTPQAVLVATDCADVRSRFANEAGLEAEDLLAAATGVNTTSIEFAAGETSTVINHAVIAGERDVYVLNADGGQQMEVVLTAMEQNAAFDVVSPSGDVLAAGAVSETIFLPHTGDYQVIVGSSRGNATYELELTIP